MLFNFSTRLVGRGLGQAAAHTTSRRPLRTVDPFVLRDVRPCSAHGRSCSSSGSSRPRPASLTARRLVRRPWNRVGPRCRWRSPAASASVQRGRSPSSSPCAAPQLHNSCASCALGSHESAPRRARRSRRGVSRRPPRRLRRSPDGSRACRRRSNSPCGCARRFERKVGPVALVSGQPAVQHDLEPQLAGDLRRGESLALPLAVARARLRARASRSRSRSRSSSPRARLRARSRCSIVCARFVTITPYALNVVELIGLGLAVDYSLVMVSRYREELANSRRGSRRVTRTVATAGRAVAFSGVAVAIGLALLSSSRFLSSDDGSCGSADPARLGRRSIDAATRTTVVLWPSGDHGQTAMATCRRSPLAGDRSRRHVQAASSAHLAAPHY